MLLKCYLFYIHWLNSIKSNPNKIHQLIYTEGKLFYGNRFSIKYSALSLQQGLCNEALICNEKSIFDQAVLENVMQNATKKSVILQPDCGAWYRESNAMIKQNNKTNWQGLSKSGGWGVGGWKSRGFLLLS